MELPTSVAAWIAFVFLVISLARRQKSTTTPSAAVTDERWHAVSRR